MSEHCATCASPKADPTYGAHDCTAVLKQRVEALRRDIETRTAERDTFVKQANELSETRDKWAGVAGDANGRVVLLQEGIERALHMLSSKPSAKVSAMKELVQTLRISKEK